MESRRESVRDLVRRSRQCSALPLLPPQPSRLEALPDNCIGHILSWHWPNDLASVSTSSRALFGAARQDILWKAIWLALPSPLRAAGATAGRPIYEACARAHESAIDATRRWATETFAAHWQRFGFVGACSRVVRSLGIQLDLRLFETSAKSSSMRGEPLKRSGSPLWETFKLGSSLHYAPLGKNQVSPSEVKTIEVMASIGMAAPPLNSTGGGASEETLEVTLSPSIVHGKAVSQPLALLLAASFFIHVLLPHARLAPAFASKPQRHRSSALDAAFAAAAGIPPTNSASEPTDKKTQRKARATLSVAVCFRSFSAVLWECAFTRRRFDAGDKGASGWRSSAPPGSLTPVNSAPLPLPPDATPPQTASCLLLTDGVPTNMADDARQMLGPTGLTAGGCSFEGSVIMDLAVWEDSSERVLWTTSAPVAMRAASGFFGRSGRRAVVLEEAQGWVWAELAPENQRPDSALKVEALSLGLQWSPYLAPTLDL